MQFVASKCKTLRCPDGRSYCTDIENTTKARWRYWTDACIELIALMVRRVREQCWRWAWSFTAWLYGELRGVNNKLKPVTLIGGVLHTHPDRITHSNPLPTNDPSLIRLPPLWWSGFLDNAKDANGCQPLSAVGSKVFSEIDPVPVPLTKIVNSYETQRVDISPDWNDGWANISFIHREGWLTPSNGTVGLVRLME